MVSVFILSVNLFTKPNNFSKNRNDEPAKLIETGAVVNGQTLDECRKNITKDLLSGNAEKGSKGIAAKHNDEKCSK